VRLQTSGAVCADAVDDERKALVRQSSSESVLPTRVIDVSTIGSIGGPRLFISHGKRASYAALSYCWGQGPQSLNITTATIASHTQVIPTVEIPSTIKDTSTITLELGFNIFG